MKRLHFHFILCTRDNNDIVVVIVPVVLIRLSSTSPVALVTIQHGIDVSSFLFYSTICALTLRLSSAIHWASFLVCVLVWLLPCLVVPRSSFFGCLFPFRRANNSQQSSRVGTPLEPSSELVSAACHRSFILILIRFRITWHITLLPHQFNLPDEIACIRWWRYCKCMKIGLFYDENWKQANEFSLS